jgi:hypothetical protein
MLQENVHLLEHSKLLPRLQPRKVSLRCTMDSSHTIVIFDVEVMPLVSSLLFKC